MTHVLDDYGNVVRWEPTKELYPGEPVRWQLPETGPRRLRVGCAHQNREEGFIHVDRVKTENVDYEYDLRLVPWPIDDAVLDTIYAGYYFHRLTLEQRHDFMNEAGRVLKLGAQVVLQAPYWSSRRAVSDPYAVWPPVCEESFACYSRAFREREHMDDLGLTCDFGDVLGVGHTCDPDLVPRSEEYQHHAKKFWVNSILDLHVTLTRAS